MKRITKIKCPINIVNGRIISADCFSYDREVSNETTLFFIYSAPAFKCNFFPFSDSHVRFRLLARGLRKMFIVQLLNCNNIIIVIVIVSCERLVKQLILFFILFYHCRIGV